MVRGGPEPLYSAQAKLFCGPSAPKVRRVNVCDKLTTVIQKKNNIEIYFNCIRSGLWGPEPLYSAQAKLFCCPSALKVRRVYVCDKLTTVIQSDNRINGLTIAASIWAVAALGMGLANGAYRLVIISTGLILISLPLLTKLEAFIDTINQSRV